MCHQQICIYSFYHINKKWWLILNCSYKATKLVRNVLIIKLEISLNIPKNNIDPRGDLLLYFIQNDCCS